MHWLIQVENPFKLYGWWATVVWLAYVAMVIFGFIILEWIGLRRIHGAVPATFVIRCGPRIAGFAFFGWCVYHFLFVVTKVQR